jgi:hypothetical protein
MLLNLIKILKLNTSEHTKDNSILHIDVGNKPIIDWVNENKYIIFSEIVRYSEKMIKGELEHINAIMISNLADNVVFILRNDSVDLTLKKAMDYFLDIEEYEQCGKIRDLLILISNRNKSIKNNGRAIKKNNLQS